MTLKYHFLKVRDLVLIIVLSFVIIRVLVFAFNIFENWMLSFERTVPFDEKFIELAQQAQAEHQHVIPIKSLTPDIDWDEVCIISFYVNLDLELEAYGKKNPLLRFMHNEGGSGYSRQFVAMFYEDGQFIAATHPKGLFYLEHKTDGCYKDDVAISLTYGGSDKQASLVGTRSEPDKTP